MSKNRDPAFLFYTADFLIGVLGLTMAERGQYITLLCLQHQKGHMSLDFINENIEKVSKKVLGKFDVDEDGNYYNDRLDEEIANRKRFTDACRENGKKGGRLPQKTKPDKNPSVTRRLTDGKPSANLALTQTKPKQNLAENENVNEIITKDISNTNTVKITNNLSNTSTFPFSKTTTTTKYMFVQAHAREFPTISEFEDEDMQFYLLISEAFGECEAKSNVDDFIAYNDARDWRGIGGESVLDNLHRYITRWDKGERWRNNRQEVN